MQSHKDPYDIDYMKMILLFNIYMYLTQILPDAKNKGLLSWIVSGKYRKNNWIRFDGLTDGPSDCSCVYTWK